jgi:hypothetical protein
LRRTFNVFTAKDARDAKEEPSTTGMKQELGKQFVRKKADSVVPDTTSIPPHFRFSFYLASLASFAVNVFQLFGDQDD